MKIFNFLFRKKQTEQRFKKVNKTFTDKEISLAVKWVMDEISLNKLQNELKLKSPTGCYVFVAYALKSYINKNLTQLASSILKDRVYNDIGFDELPKYPVPERFKVKKVRPKKKKQKKVYDPVCCDHVHPSGDKCNWQGSRKGLFFHKRWHSLLHIVSCPNCDWVGTAKGLESHKRIHKLEQINVPVYVQNDLQKAKEVSDHMRKKTWAWKAEARDLLGNNKFSKSPTKFMRKKYPHLIEKI
jgi:hypothetical protein